MFELEPAYWAIVAVSAIIPSVAMAVAIVRMMTRRAEVRGEARDGTAFESGIADTHHPEGARAFDVWSYRVPARFAGRLRVVLYDDHAVVCGPRIGAGLYWVWIWVQSLLLTSVFGAAAWALVATDWRPLLIALLLAFSSWTISTIGALTWPGLGELPIVDGGRLPAVEFPLSSVSVVTVGEGWSFGGLEWVLFPYKKGIDAMSAGRAVSFFAPDGTGHECRYALHAFSDEGAQALATLLEAGADVSESGATGNDS